MRSRPTDKRVDAGPQRGDLAFGAALAGLKFGDAFVGEPQCGHGPVVVLVEPDLAGVEFTDAALHRLELGLRLLRAGARLLDVRRVSRATVSSMDSTRVRMVSTWPASRASPSRRSASARTAARWARSASAATRSRSVSSSRAASSRSRRLGQLGEQLPFVRGDLVGLGLQRVGIGAAGRLLLGVEVLGALTGDADRRADPFGQRRQPEPALLGGSRRAR